MSSLWSVICNQIVVYIMILQVDLFIGILENSMLKWWHIYIHLRYQEHLNTYTFVQSGSLNQSGDFSQNIIIYKAFPHTGQSLIQYYFFVVFPHSWNHTVYTIETIVCDNPRRSAVSEILRPAQLVPKNHATVKVHITLFPHLDVCCDLMNCEMM